MCPNVSEKPERGYFWGPGMLKISAYKLMVIAAFLYAISA